MSFDLLINPVAPESVIPGTNYVIKPRNSEMAVSVQNASTENGALIIQNTFNNTANQQWKLSLTSTGSIYWRISPVHALAKRLEVKDMSQSDGGTLQLNDNWGNTNQQWQIIEPEPGIYQFKARHSGKCLDMEGMVTTEDAIPRQWTCNDSERQLFTLTVAGEPNLINELDISEDLIKVYQNQGTTGGIMIDISNIDKPLELTVTDLNGRVIYRDVLLIGRIIAPELNFHPGIYLVNVKSKHSVSNIKFVKE